MPERRSRKPLWLCLCGAALLGFGAVTWGLVTYVHLVRLQVAVTDASAPGATHTPG